MTYMSQGKIKKIYSKRFRFLGSSLRCYAFQVALMLEFTSFTLLVTGKCVYDSMFGL